MGTAPKPFALKEQYVPAVSAARDAAGVEEAESENEAQGPARKRKGNPGDDQTPWNYAEVRNKWIDQCRMDNNVSYKEAKKMWESSDAKRNYLKHVSLQELKRRKFLPKGATTNPWSE